MMSIARVVNSIMTTESGNFHSQIWTNCVVACSTAAAVVPLALFVQQRFLRRQNGLVMQGLFVFEFEYKMAFNRADMSCVKVGSGIETGPTQPDADLTHTSHEFLAHTQPGRISVAFEYNNAVGMLRDMSTDRSFKVTANKV